MTRFRSVTALALAGALLLGGCAVVMPGGPPPQAPAYGARAKMPPRITIAPAVAVIASSPVAYASNYPDDLFFYEGRWYRPFEGNWYWSVTVGGEWAQISVGQVPKVILEVPADYRTRKGGPPPWAPAHGARRKKG